jgi:hypothetical protein
MLDGGWFMDMDEEIDSEGDSGWLNDLEEKAIQAQYCCFTKEL